MAVSSLSVFQSLTVILNDFESNQNIAVIPILAPGYCPGTQRKRQPVNCGKKNLINNSIKQNCNMNIIAWITHVSMFHKPSKRLWNCQLSHYQAADGVSPSLSSPVYVWIYGNCLHRVWVHHLHGVIVTLWNPHKRPWPLWTEAASCFHCFHFSCVKNRWHEILLLVQQVNMWQIPKLRTILTRLEKFNC